MEKELKISAIQNGTATQCSPATFDLPYSDIFKFAAKKLIF
jgi:hypothetical protein